MLERGLIVSCQAGEGEPLHGFNIMHLMARAAKAGGAVGIRALYYDVDSIKNEVNLPVIGLVKQNYNDSPIYITPTKKEVDLVLNTKADVIALDATMRVRPNGETLEDIVKYVRSKNPKIEIMADVATLEEALNAEKLGFDYISTTLRGYTEQTKGKKLPDISFMKLLTKKIKNSKIICEGGVYELADMKKINKLNPYAIVVGSSITRPALITKRFNSVINLK